MTRRRRTHEFTLDADSDARASICSSPRELGISRTQAATLIANGQRDRRRQAREGELPPGARRTRSWSMMPAAAVARGARRGHPARRRLRGRRRAGRGQAGGNGRASGARQLDRHARERAQGARRRARRRRAARTAQGIVHRLDKETSGLLLVAKTDRAHRMLGAATRRRAEIVRRYAALSWGHLDGDRLTVDKPIARDPRDRKRMAIVSTGRAAKTDFVRLARFDSVDLLRAHLHTGRTHQIRVHLASVGHPVVGDDTYGGGGGRRLVELPPRRHFLHAAWLLFRHPVTGEPSSFARRCRRSCGDRSPPSRSSEAFAGAPGPAGLSLASTDSTP